MSWRDRPYAGEGGDSFGGSALGLPKPTPVVSGILIPCLVVFVITMLTRSMGGPLVAWGALALPPYKPAWQIWRWVTYQYLHANVIHIFFNMIGLYFLGPPLERLWGSRTFLLFYTFCGIVAGLGFAVLYWLLPASYVADILIGASGSVLGCVAACAILFPHMMLILVFFPVPIRTAAILLGVLFVLYIISEGNLAQAAHLAGMAGGAAWVYGPRRWPALQVRSRLRRGAWARKIESLQADEEKVDQILDKIRQHGMQSLTWWEKRFLHKASARRRQLDEQQSRR
jgi:membrane associated rhomboid family serine protease